MTDDNVVYLTPRMLTDEELGLTRDERRYLCHVVLPALMRGERLPGVDEFTCRRLSRDAQQFMAELFGWTPP